VLPPTMTLRNMVYIPLLTSATCMWLCTGAQDEVTC
jgi:hypothetical protein